MSSTSSARLLAIVVFLGAAVRIWGLGFGLPLSQARPDETSVAGPALAALLGQFRPPDFNYPTFFIYALALLYLAWYVILWPLARHASIAAFVETGRQSLSLFLYTSRGLSALMGTLTIVSVFTIARRMFDETIAMVAALFLALSFLHARDSHFGVTDVTMTALVTLTVLLILKWQDTGAPKQAALAGLAGGLAMATKYNGLGIVLPFGIAVFDRMISSRRDGTVSSTITSAVAFCVTFVVAFVSAFPWVLIDWTAVSADASGVASHLSLGHGIAMPIGWWYHAQVTLPAALGWPVYLAGAAGALLLLISRFRQSIVLLAFPIAYYTVAGSGHTVFARYMVPVLPFLAICAGWLVVTAVRRALAGLTASAQNAAIAAIAMLMIAPSASRLVLLDRLLARTDNRVVAARTLVDLIPAGSIVYQSGEMYGLAPYTIDGRSLDIHQRGFSRGHFTPEGERLPDWIVLQRSPLALYSEVPEEVEHLVRERYVKVASLIAAPEMSGRLYDQQDAFFLPLDHLAGIDRPGPNFDVYRLVVKTAD